MSLDCTKRKSASPAQDPQLPFAWLRSVRLPVDRPARSFFRFGTRKQLILTARTQDRDLRQYNSLLLLRSAWRLRLQSDPNPTRLHARIYLAVLLRKIRRHNRRQSGVADQAQPDRRPNSATHLPLPRWSGKKPAGAMRRGVCNVHRALVVVLAIPLMRD